MKNTEKIVQIRKKLFTTLSDYIKTSFNLIKENKYLYCYD